MADDSEQPTIVTLTLGPSLDLSSSVAEIEPWRKMRCADDRLDPGGGGLNVARVVRQLGGHPLAVVALGGHVGSQVAAALTLDGVPFVRVRTRQTTRQNFSVTERSTGQQFRFVHAAADMSPGEWRRCLDATVEAASAGAACVVASGSTPHSVPVDVYAQLGRRLAPVGVPFVVDTSGPALGAAIEHGATLVKPSANELAALVGRTLVGIDEHVTAAREVLARGGCAAMVVSLGAGGALLVPADGAATAFDAPEVEVRSTTGAGDSMVAGMALAIARGDDLVDAVRWGVAAGSATVMRVGTALAQRDDVVRLAAGIVPRPV